MLNGVKSWGRPFTKAAWAQPLQWARAASVLANRSVLDRVFGSPAEWLQPKCAFYMWTDQHYSDKYFLWPRCTESLKGHRISQLCQKTLLVLVKMLGFLSFFFAISLFVVVLSLCGFVWFFPFCFLLFCSFFKYKKVAALIFLIAIKCWRSQHANI